MLIHLEWLTEKMRFEKKENQMSRIYVAMSEAEIALLDDLKMKWEERCGCSISRQKFARTLLINELVRTSPKQMRAQKNTRILQE